MAAATRLWGPVILWMALIFAASSLTFPGGGPAVPDWLTHGILYLTLSVLVYRALAGGLARPLPIATAALAVLCATLYGITDEVHQSFVPTRHAEAADVGKDFGGALVGAVLCRRLGARARRAGAEGS